LTSDALIVGGGIVGCACAYYLAQEGITSTILEPGPIGGGATAAGMGHVVVMDDSEPQFALTRYSQQLWDEVYPLLPQACEVRRTGTLWVAADEEEFTHVKAKLDYYTSRGVNVEALDQQALREAEPNLHPDLTGALLVPQDSVIYPMAAAKWLLDQSRTKHQRQRATKIEGNRVTLADGSQLSAALVINAAGGHAPQLTPGLPIEPRKGHLVITDRYPGYVNRQIIELGYLKSAHSHSIESVAFNVQPRATGQLLLGSSRQYVGWDPKVDRALLSKMIERAEEYMPGLKDLNVIRTWVGFRAATKSKLPIICPWEENLYIAAGHEGLGITTCMATGRLIADMVSGKRSLIDRSPYVVPPSEAACLPSVPAASSRPAPDAHNQNA
jgi:glycine/D-amino acid oxidase-like deaminating enzyme